MLENPLEENKRLKLKEIGIFALFYLIVFLCVILTFTIGWFFERMPK